MKSADTTSTSEKAADQGKDWRSWCSTVSNPPNLPGGAYRKHLTLVTQTALPPQSKLLSTAPFPPNQTAVVLEGLLLIQRRGHPQSLISSRALDEFRFCELENLALWFFAISYARHVPCTPFEDTVKEMGTLPTGALGTATPSESSSCVKGSTRNPANMHQGNSFSLLLLCCFLSFSANTVSFQLPYSSQTGV